MGKEGEEHKKLIKYFLVVLSFALSHSYAVYNNVET